MRPANPWFSSMIKSERIKKRKLEKKWRRSKLQVDREIYLNQSNKLKDAIKSAKNEYFSNIIDANSDQRVLFNAFDKMTN